MSFEALHDHIDVWYRGILSTPALRAHLEAALAEHSMTLGTRQAAYMEVLGQLLMRIEGAASFTEESCSFSQGDFAASLHDWVNKLHGRVAQNLAG